MQKSNIKIDISSGCDGIGGGDCGGLVMIDEITKFGF